MTITAEILQQQLAQLDAQEAQLRANLHGIEGARQVVKRLLDHLAQSEIAPESVL